MVDQLPRSLKWGRVRVSRIRKSTDNLRDAIRRGDMDAIQTAWDDYEQFVQYPFTSDPRVEGLVEALTALEKEVTRTISIGAQTGPHWSRITIANLKARSKLAECKGN